MISVLSCRFLPKEETEVFLVTDGTCPKVKKQGSNQKSPISGDVAEDIGEFCFTGGKAGL